MEADSQGADAAEAPSPAARANTLIQMLNGEVVDAKEGEKEPTTADSVPAAILTDDPKSRLWLNWDSLERRIKKGKWIVVSASLDHSLKIWDLSSRECRGTLFSDVHDGAIRCAAVDLESRVCISGSVDGTLGIWNMEECLCNDSYISAKLGSQLCLQVDWREDVKCAITGTGDGKLCIWDASNCSSRGTIHAHPGTRVTALIADFEHKRALSGGQDGILKLWDLETFQSLGTFKEHRKSPISCLAASFKKDDQRAISGAEDGSLFFIDLEPDEDGAYLTGFEKLEGHTDRVTVVRVDWESDCALTGSNDETICIWNLEELSCTGTWKGHKGAIRDLSVDFQEKVALSASDDCTLRAWNFDGTVAGVLTGHKDRVTCCHMRLERELACSGSIDGTIKVWDLDKMKEEDTFFGHSAGIVTICS